jgi:hypothetical protein
VNTVSENAPPQMSKKSISNDHLKNSGCVETYKWVKLSMRFLAEKLPDSIVSGFLVSVLV